MNNLALGHPFPLFYFCQLSYLIQLTGAIVGIRLLESPREICRHVWGESDREFSALEFRRTVGGMGSSFIAKCEQCNLEAYRCIGGGYGEFRGILRVARYLPFL